MRSACCGVAPRLADRLNAPWYVVYVKTPTEEANLVDAATQRQITNMLTLTQQMGGTPLASQGSDIVEAIATFSKEYGITHLVMGRTQRPWYRRLWEGSILERLLREIPDVDVIVVSNR